MAFHTSAGSRCLCQQRATNGESPMSNEQQIISWRDGAKVAIHLRQHMGCICNIALYEVFVCHDCISM